MEAKTHSLLFIYCRLSGSPSELPGHIYLQDTIVEDMKIEAIVSTDISVQPPKENPLFPTSHCLPEELRRRSLLKGRPSPPFLATRRYSPPSGQVSPQEHLGKHCCHEGAVQGRAAANTKLRAVSLLLSLLW